MYEKAIVTFLDILGFRDIVANSDATKIHEILKIVEEVATPDTTEKWLYNPETIVFSDSIVRTRKINTEENIQYPIGLVFHELLDIVHAQSELIDHGILIRGGIAFGDIYIDKNQIFGPALIRAYDLENKFAKYPRLIVDPELIKELKQNKLLRKYGHSVEQESEHISELVRQSDDGLWFIDYARAIESELNEPEMYPDFLIKHRDLIIKNSSNFKNYDKNMEKYVWLASYHNALVNEIKQKWFKHYGLKRKELLINSSEIPALQYIEP